MEERALELHRSLYTANILDSCIPLRLLVKNPVFPVQREDKALSFSWYIALSTLISNSDFTHLRLITIYLAQFRDRVHISARQARNLLKKSEDLISPHTPDILFNFTLNRDFYTHILGQKLLSPERLEQMPNAFLSCYSELADFGTYLERIRADFGRNETLKFACFGLENEKLSLEECIDHAIKSHSLQVILDLTHYTAAPILTGYQYSTVYIECRNPNHPPFQKLHNNHPIGFQFQDLHFNFKPVPFAILELLSENIYLLTKFLIGKVLPYKEKVLSFSLLAKLAEAYQIRDNFHEFFKRFPPCLQRHFHRLPTSIEHADELYYILNRTTDEHSVHPFITPFLPAGPDTVLEEVLRLAIADRLIPVVQFIGHV